MLGVSASLISSSHRQGAQTKSLLTERVSRAGILISESICSKLQRSRPSRGECHSIPSGFSAMLTSFNEVAPHGASATWLGGSNANTSLLLQRSCSSRSECHPRAQNARPLRHHASTKSPLMERVSRIHLLDLLGLVVASTKSLLTERVSPRSRNQLISLPDFRAVREPNRNAFPNEPSGSCLIANSWSPLTCEPPGMAPSACGSHQTI